MEEKNEFIASPAMQDYFKEIIEGVTKAHTLATKAREKGLDPENHVEIKLAKNMAERVVGLISTMAPQIVDSGAVERIIELEKEYGKLDWRVAFKIAEEIALQKFCKFDTELEAIEIGVRTGFAYVTVGVVTAPLEGLSNLEIKDRQDGNGQYFCLNFAGPVRNAGGTAAATCVLIADYVRKKTGYAQYDPTDDEVKRIHTEITDYHERVTNLQYFPSREESDFLGKNMPIEINGDASEKFEVSNYKDLPRVKTNLIRSGYCLLYSSCVPLKAEKLWKQLSKWGKDFDMDQWDFLGDFVALKKKMHAKGGDTKDEGEKPKISPDHTYVADLVAGRPILGYPMRKGGFRLRYGRSRTSGFSAQCVHPATMHVLNDYIATATQLKVERPGKGAAFTPCDTIQGPIVKLTDGSVVLLDTESKAKQCKKKVKDVLFLGDVLVNYGDFLNRAHVLATPGYCEEWWIKEFEKAAKEMFGEFNLDKISEHTTIPKEPLEKLFNDPLRMKISFDGAKLLSTKMNIPLHPSYVYHWPDITQEDLYSLVTWLRKKKLHIEEGRIKKMILPLEENPKRILEELGVPHNVASNAYVVVDAGCTSSLLYTLNLDNTDEDNILMRIDQMKGRNVLEMVNEFCPGKIRDKSGVYIGSRMGRPEKAKMRKMTGSPHVLFPVGEEGGRMRSFQTALTKGKITAEFPKYLCTECDRESLYARCDNCGSETTQTFRCKICGDSEEDACEIHGKNEKYSKRTIDIDSIFRLTLKKLGMQQYPDLIKGVKGTSNKDHLPEHLSKGILRAYHDIFVNKDGTIRYDCSEIPATHFKPKEVGVSPERLVEIGYTTDIHNNPLTDDNQILEIKPQDIVIPACPDSPDEGCDEVLFRTTRFIDDLLTKHYGLEPFYNLKSKKDLVGHYIIGLAPHTSAASVCRIIGFSKTQGFLSHPLIHAAMRRDCFTYDTKIPIKKGKNWEIIELGKLVEELNPTDVVDDFGTREIEVNGFKTLGLKNNKLSEVQILNFTKHTPQKIVEIKTKLGRNLKTTYNHKHITKKGMKRAFELKKGNFLKIPYSLDILKKDYRELNLLEMFKDSDWVMVKGLCSQIKNLKKLLQQKNLKNSQIKNYINRDSVPLSVVYDLIGKKIDKNKLTISAKRDQVQIPCLIEVNKQFLNILGLYVAEGYSRKKQGAKGLYQIYISAEKSQIREFVKDYFARNFRLSPSERKLDRVTYSSRILYELFTNLLGMGSNAHEKRMPKKFLNLPNKKLGWLLSGYLEGDGSVSKTDLRIAFDIVSKGLLQDIGFILGQMRVFVKLKQYTKKPGPKVREFYLKNKKQVPLFTITEGTLQSKFMDIMKDHVKFLSDEKQSIFEFILKNKKCRNLFLEYDSKYFFDEIDSVKFSEEETSYCLNVENNTVVANGILTRQCDGDESCISLLMDAFLNFSARYLPSSRGAKMDAPLVLTSILTPGEVDDMAFDVDRAWEYPIEFYEACEQYKMPWEVKIPLINHVLDTPEQYEGMGFTHDTDNFNAGVLCSAYKTLPSMDDKLAGQMEIAERVRAVESSEVARLVIEKHFIRDTKGNLRKFSQQEFRCVSCNQKYRRPPLVGKCTECGGKLLFTISEGSVVKYLDKSINLANKYNVPDYLKQTLDLLRKRVDSVFGKEKELQTGLGGWIGAK